MKKLILVAGLLFCFSLQAKFEVYFTTIDTCIKNGNVWVEMPEYHIYNIDTNVVVYRVDYMFRQNKDWELNFHNQGLTLHEGYNQVGLLMLHEGEYKLFKGEIGLDKMFKGSRFI